MIADTYMVWNTMKINIRAIVLSIVVALSLIFFVCCDHFWIGDFEFVRDENGDWTMPHNGDNP